jgi:hypothetical protein
MTPAESTNTPLLINLFYVNWTCELARKLLESIDLKEVMQTHLEGKIHSLWDIDSTFDFEGTVIELFAHSASHTPHPFRTLLEQGGQYIDASTVLLSLISSRIHIRPNTPDDCLLSQLLELGANVNKSGFWVTPLQIAVAWFDLAVVKMLLEAGADPNGIGDSNGTEWNDNSLLGQFKDLHAASPLRICRFSSYGFVDMREEIAAELLQYGAKDFGRIMEQRQSLQLKSID